jgi:hypothetical protein
LYPWTLLPGFVSELALCVWLVVKGINVPRWNETVDSARTGLVV